MRVTREIFSLKIQSDTFGNLKHVATQQDKNISKLSVHGKVGTIYTTRNVVQIFLMVKCIAASEVTLTTHLAHPPLYHSIDLILFTFSQP